ncbi:hypothetical protein B296_00027972 [Ensete ventricosum]|uniref:Uncharacterized protein n=1 Tax=Ensete ventricosum TaxID=4639 RepID=A0A427AJ83_ENSVE|nr:hypothetical protein B296_00027972 [Ensete ventricosum]
MDGASDTDGEANPRPQVVNPSGSPKVVVVSSSSGGMTPGDTKAYTTLSVMWSCHDCDSTIIGQESAPEKRSKSKGKESRKEAVGGQCHPLVMKDLCEMGGRVINMQAEWIFTLQSEVLDWKSCTGLEAAADLDAEVERLKAALGSAKQEANRSRN